MITLSYQNVSDLVFYDKKVQQVLPELSGVFRKWTLGMRTGLNSIIKDALLDFLNDITTEHISKLEEYWGSPVVVQRLNSCIVKNEKHTLDVLGSCLNNIGDEYWNVSISQDDDLIYISFWR